ncbi:MAG: tetrahydrofolate dehydrogenase/cyclohydrolase catalytic domain-containing protein, partial [Oscillospiraceae bacterium]
MAELLKGAAVAEAINQRSKTEIEKLNLQNIFPTLAILRVGAREDDLAYEKGAIKRCEKVGVQVRQLILPEEVSQEALLGEISALNEDADIHGVLIFMPLPKHLDGEAVRRALSPEKDIDGITSGSLAGVFTGSGEGFAPC